MKKNKKNIIPNIIIGLIVIILLLGFLFQRSIKPEKLSYTDFVSKIENGEFEKVEIEGNIATGYTIISSENVKGKEKYEVKIDGLKENIANKLIESGIDFKIAETSLFTYLKKAGSILLNLLIIIFAFGMIGIIQAKSMDLKRPIDVDKKVNVKLDDVAGQDEAKLLLGEIVDMLKNDEKKNDIGGEMPKGVLLVGPPGTGKTMLAKAVAGESGVKFISVSGSEFVQLYVGLGAQRVRQIFKEAKENSPCIIFIDELDSIGNRRGRNSNREEEQTLNQLLTEMDGFSSDNNDIIVMGATNTPESLDKALLRPGRFDRIITVDKPDVSGRKAIFESYLKKVKTAENINSDHLALITAGATGADIKNIVNESALLATRNKKEQIEEIDLMDSVEIVFAGREKKDRVLTTSEKKVVAIHEIGHATVSIAVGSRNKLHKITIIPRTMGSLGFTMQLPAEERFLESREELAKEMMILMGGRVAEEILVGDITSGASNDIEEATKIARKMVMKYGMSDEIGFVMLESDDKTFLKTESTELFKANVMNIAEKEVLSILQHYYNQTRKIVKGNIDIIERASMHLYEKENIQGEVFSLFFKESGKAIPFEYYDSKKHSSSITNTNTKMIQENKSNTNPASPSNKKEEFKKVEKGQPKKPNVASQEIPPPPDMEEPKFEFTGDEGKKSPNKKGQSNPLSGKKPPQTPLYQGLGNKKGGNGTGRKVVDSE